MEVSDGALLPFPPPPPLASSSSELPVSGFSASDTALGALALGCFRSLPGVLWRVETEGRAGIRGGIRGLLLEAIRTPLLFLFCLPMKRFQSRTKGGLEDFRGEVRGSNRPW